MKLTAKDFRNFDYIFSILYLYSTADQNQNPTDCADSATQPIKKRKLYKKRAKWTMEAEKFLVEIWELKEDQLRGPRKNGHIFKEMEEEFKLKGFHFTADEIHMKIQNLKKKYR